MGIPVLNSFIVAILAPLVLTYAFRRFINWLIYVVVLLIWIAAGVCFFSETWHNMNAYQFLSQSDWFLFTLWAALLVGLSFYVLEQSGSKPSD